MSWSTKMWRGSTLTVALGLLVAAAGCGQERDPVNRVQPDVFDKTFFVGDNLQDSSDDPEFYSQATLVDVGYGADQSGLFTSTYTQQLSRLKWTIQENYLIGRLTHERIDGTDGRGTGTGFLKNEGVVAAMFKIQKHFDIQRSYNSTTGEELNIIEENTSDRPWYQRKYMRVDWSSNLNTDSYDFDTLSLLGIYGGIKYEPVSYYVNDPTSLDAPRFALDEGYFDITTKAFAVPQQVDLRHLGWGIDSFPACFLPTDFAGGTGPTANCNPVELTLRQSFRRVPNNDYEPMKMDGYEFQAYGAFLSERAGYARNYGMTDDREYRFVNRYNIWQRSHYYADPVNMEGPVECYTPKTTKAGEDPNRDLAGNGTADECETVGNGSQCDTFTQTCTLPYREREIRPQPWYYTTGSAPLYFESTERAVQEWDTAMRAAVMAARYSECQATGSGKDRPCADQYPIYFGQQDENDDAMALSREVDSCLWGRAYSEYAGKCDQLANDIGKARGYSPGVIAISKMDRIVVLCHSPVEHGDPAECGYPRLPAHITAEMCDDARETGDREMIAKCGVGIEARIGDLRYHQVNVIKNPQTPSPWGIMVDSHDPLTGEKVAASINVWSHVTDIASQGLIDMARYAAGELTTEEVTEGQYVQDWSKVAEAASSGGSALSPMTLNERDQILADVTGLSLQKFRAADLQQLPRQVQQRVRETDMELRGIRADAHSTSQSKPFYEARRKAAIGTQLEAALTTKAMQQYAGVDQAGLAQSALGTALASPFQGASPSFDRELRNRKELILAERGTCMIDVAAPAPVALANLSAHLQRKFGDFDRFKSKQEQIDRAEKMRRYIAEKYNYAVIAHEIGHSIALRHNFVSSSDAWGYRPQYWQLRTDNGTRTEVCTDLREPEGCVGPRYFDPVTKHQGEQLIQMFMHSSVMDYAGEATQDLLGLGAYDFAATRYFYGGTTAVFKDESYQAGKPRGTGMLEKMDNFGGTVGIKPSIGADNAVNNAVPFHYSQIQNVFEVIQDCYVVDPMDYVPAVWNEERDGKWDPLLDGLFVKVNGEYTRCRQQKVDYVPFSSLRFPTDDEITPVRNYRGGPAIDADRRVRVPYGFATDSWADLGNLSVFRHDNGADPYEFFDFLITQQEMNHIFDNYRRNRATFSVRGAANRALSRYNEKLRDAAKGLGLQTNFYRKLSTEIGYDSASLWVAAVKSNAYEDNLIAAAIAFDHFTRMIARPQAGKHNPVTWRNGADPVLRFDSSPDNPERPPELVIPTGATGNFGNVGFGGKLMENSFARDRGEFDNRYTINAGSYYDKVWAPMLMTESVDNFVNSSLDDFTDARYRSVSLADLFPDGYRRWLANNLTGDDEIKAPRIALNSSGKAEIDGVFKFPTHGIGWTSWLPKSGPENCFAENDTLLCSNSAPVRTRPIDPQVGWEQQKFLIAMTLMYLPENAKQGWLNEMRIWELGAENDPGFPNRIEFHDPFGKIYVAKTFGKETIFGKVVQRGIAARVLEWANILTDRAFVTTPGPDLDGDGEPDWYIPVLGANGLPQVKFDPSMIHLTEDWMLGPIPEHCNATDNSECTCESNRSCLLLESYTEVPFFLRQAMTTYSFGDTSMKGIY